jgi:uncharacterized membrane protein YfcA
MKDTLILLVAALVCAVLSWLFFAYFQNSAFTIMLAIFVIAILAKPLYKQYRDRDK